MDKWITLQQAAKKVGKSKNTLSMWRLRNKFPFEAKRDGRNLMVSDASVNTWLKENKGKAPKGRKPAATTSKATLEIKGNLDLETVHRFVNDIQSGANVQILTAKEGYVIKTVR